MHRLVSILCNIIRFLKNKKITIKICLATIINIMQRQEEGGEEKNGKKISYLLRQGAQKCESLVGRTTNVLFNIQNFFFLSGIYNPL